MRVRYADTDQMGVVYYANYLVWFEVGRTEWLRDAGWNYRDMEEAGVSLPVIEAHCEYRQPARYDDEIEIRTRATVLTPVRLRFDYQAVRTAGEALCRRGAHGACRARRERTAVPASGSCEGTARISHSHTGPPDVCISLAVQLRVVRDRTA